ncbi:MAG TPA: class I SAM-dependent methyltransferase [Thermoanaerobaculia bacterium]
MPWNEQSYLRFFPPLTWQSDPQIESVLSRVKPGARVVDLGAGGRRISPSTICVDFIPFRGTNLVADVHRLPVEDGSVDLVVATGLLEHVNDDHTVVREIVRILRPGGLVHIEIPFLQQYHQDPIDCRRLTVEGLELELRREGLEPVKSGSHIGPTVTMITLGAYYASLWFEGKSRLSRAISSGVFLLWSAVFYPFKFLDRFLANKRSAHRLAFGVFCTAKKRETASRGLPEAEAQEARELAAFTASARVS